MADIKKYEKPELNDLRINVKIGVGDCCTGTGDAECGDGCNATNKCRTGGSANVNCNVGEAAGNCIGGNTA